MPFSLVEESRAVLLVKMYQHFRVGSRVKHVPLVLQFIPYLLVIVYFPVENDANRFVLVEYGLVAASRHVDDRQSPVPEGEIPVDINSLIVRTAVFYGGQHFRHQFLVILVAFKYPGYSTHFISSL